MPPAQQAHDVSPLTLVIKHAIVGEDVVIDAIALEVGIFHSTIAHDARGLTQVLLGVRLHLAFGDLVVPALLQRLV